MKAKELAELLLQNPEDEVFIEILQSSSDGDYYHQTHKLSGLAERTPDGTFLNMDWMSIREEIKTPSNKPLIGAARVKLDSYLYDFLPCEDSWDSRRSDLDNGEFWRELFNSGYYYCYVYNGDSVIFEHSTEMNPNLGRDYVDRHVFTPEDVEYVEVLTALDENWDQTWTRMTYEEAYEYFTKDLQAEENEE